MSTSFKLAVPSMGEGGLEASRSGHFGRCDCFTIIDVVDGKLGDVSILDNPPHEEGGCLRPVQLLGDAGVDAIIAAGMGMRPFMGFSDAGITVFHDNVHAQVGQAATLVAEGKASKMEMDNTCSHHH